MVFIGSRPRAKKVVALDLGFQRKICTQGGSRANQAFLLPFSTASAPDLGHINRFLIFGTSAAQRKNVEHTGKRPSPATGECFALRPDFGCAENEILKGGGAVAAVHWAKRETEEKGRGINESDR